MEMKLKKKIDMKIKKMKLKDTIYRKMDMKNEMK